MFRFEGEMVDGAISKKIKSESGGSASESAKIDPLEINNKIVDLKSKARTGMNQEKENMAAYKKALADMTREEIDAVAKMIAEKPESILVMLANYDNKPEIAGHAAILEVLKEELAKGSYNLFDIDRILDLPGADVLFDDPGVKEGVAGNVGRFIKNRNSADFKASLDVIERVVEGSRLGKEDLKKIAKSIQSETNLFREFTNKFGITWNE